MTSQRTQARWRRQQQAMSHPWHPVGLYFDFVDGRKRRRKQWERDEPEGKH